MNMTRTRPLPPLRDLCWGLAGALALWLGFPNDLLSLPPLVLLWPVALAVLGLRAPGRMAALRRGWLVSLAGGTAVLYWLTLPVHNVGGLPWLLAVPCALFIASCLASAGGLFSLAAYLLRARPPLTLALLLALLWYLLEACYALALGFPWLPLAGALAVWPPVWGWPRCCWATGPGGWTPIPFSPRPQDRTAWPCFLWKAMWIRTGNGCPPSSARQWSSI